MEKQRLAENDSQPKFPAAGDIVTARGNLRVRPGFPMMILQFAEGLAIVRPEADRVTIENMVENAGMFNEYQRLEIGWDENQLVKIINIENLRASWAPKPWATKLTLYELGSETEVSLMIPIVYTKFGSLKAEIGDTIRVKGAFQFYYGKPQLWLASWDDLEVL